MIHCDIMDTTEYQTLYKNAKLAYPNEYDYFIQLACIDYLSREAEQNIKSDNIIEDEV